MSTITQIIADVYRKMVNPPQAVARPKWVPASVNEESVPAFVQAVTEARKANQSVVEFNGKKYGITVKEDASEEDQGQAKKIQDMDAENAPKQPSDEVPDEVKEEDSEEIKMDNHDEKEADADEMPKLDEPKMDEELVGNQHKLDVNKNGKIDGEDLKKLRGEETEEGEEEEDEKDSEEDEKEEDEKPKMTGEQTIASVAATYAAMVNENVAGDPHAAALSAKANSLSALAHSSHSDTHHADARDAHRAAAEHYRVYAHHGSGQSLRSAALIHHTFHDDMWKHHVLHLVASDINKPKPSSVKQAYAHHGSGQSLRSVKEEATEKAAKHYGKKSVAEGAPGDAEAGPEVMDPATQKMKDDADDETELKDGVPGAAQDGGDKVSPADKPAAANSSAALPKVKVITAPVMTNESMTAIVTRKNSDGSYDEVGMSNKTVVRGSHSNILKKAKEYAKGPHRVELFHGDRIGYGSPHKVIHSE
jgi:hypothetical protein